MVVDEDGQAQEEQPQTSDDEGPDAEYDEDDDDDEELAVRRGRSPRVVDVPIDDRQRGLLDEEAEARRPTRRWR